MELNTEEKGWAHEALTAAGITQAVLDKPCGRWGDTRFDMLIELLSDVTSEVEAQVREAASETARENVAQHAGGDDD